MKLHIRGTYNDLLTNTNFDYNYKLHSKHAIIKYIQNEKNHGHLSIIAKSKIGKPIMIICHNPNFRLTTKARACKVASQEGSWESHYMLLGM